MKCSCQQKGATRSGMAGVIAGPPGKLGRRVIERCDSCERFSTDEAAALRYVTSKGGVAYYDAACRVIWRPR